MEISEVNPDGNVYQLKDSTARAGLAQIGAQNVYSTTEVETGKKWIDGKLIYRKVFTLSLTITADDVTVIIPISSLPTIETMVHMEGFQQVTTGGYVPMNSFLERLTYSKTEARNGIAFETKIARNNVPVTIIIEYTKA